MQSQHTQEPTPNFKSFPHRYKEDGPEREREQRAIEIFIISFKLEKGRERKYQMDFVNDFVSK